VWFNILGFNPLAQAFRLLNRLKVAKILHISRQAIHLPFRSEDRNGKTVQDITCKYPVFKRLPFHPTVDEAA